MSKPQPKGPRISLIAAVSENNVIGRNNQLPWHLPSDLKRFRETTKGHPVIMGQKTFESIGRVLPGRLNIILTRDQDYKYPGAEVCHGVDEALDLAARRDREEIFIIGGGEIFKATISRADRLYLTIIEDVAEGDIFFPDYSDFKKIVSSEKGADGGQKLTFLILER